MEAIVFKTKETVTKNIPKIIDPASVVNLQNTVLSEKFQKEGAVIKLPPGAIGLNGPKDEIKVLPCPHSYEDGCIIIDAIALKVNNLLRVIELFNNAEKDITVVNKSLQSLQELVLSEVSGKGGIICREVIGHRATHTGRAVLIPTSDTGVEHVKLPHKIMAKLGLLEGCLVIIGRDPVIWHGSIEILKASGWNKQCIGLHPFIFKQLGADCDGDTVWVFKIPDDAKCQAEAKEASLKITRKYTNTVSNEGNAEPATPVTDENFMALAGSTGAYNGFSISPEDIVGNSEHVVRFCDNIKNVKEEASKIASGLTSKELTEYALVLNTTMLVQKVYLGPIGAASNKLKLIAGNSPMFLESAAKLSEEAQQALFDYKGQIGSDMDKGLDILEILKIVNMQGRFKTLPGRSGGHNMAIKAIMAYGLSDACIPILTYIYTIEPLLRTFMDLRGFDVLEQNGTIEDAIGMGEPTIAVDSAKCLALIKELAKRNGLSAETILSGLNKNRTGNTLGRILSDPLYNIMNNLSSKKLLDEIEHVRVMLSANKVETTPISSFTRSILKEAIHVE